MSGIAKSFDRQKTDECLLGQAQLCERIASACADEQNAQKFRDLAQQCREAAAKK
jgi:hypothetical protein